MSWSKTNSPFITDVHYDAARRVLIVRYGSGKHQAFGDVPQVEVANLVHAPSLREYWFKHFNGRYQELPTEPLELTLVKP